MVFFPSHSAFSFSTFYFSVLVCNFVVNGAGSWQSSAAGFHRFMTAINAPPISLNIRHSQNRPSPTAYSQRTRPVNSVVISQIVFLLFFSERGNHNVTTNPSVLITSSVFISSELEVSKKFIKCRQYQTFWSNKKPSNSCKIPNAFKDTSLVKI